MKKIVTTSVLIFFHIKRSHALDLGFTLNEYSLRPMEAMQPQKPLPISSEEDIFDYLSMEFKHPYERSV